MSRFHRVTKIPIKPGSMPDLIKVAEGAEMQAHLKTFVGFLGVDTMGIGDDTMVTHSRWESKEACGGGVAALGSVLKGFMGAFIAGPPVSGGRRGKLGIPTSQIAVRKLPTLREAL